MDIQELLAREIKSQNRSHAYLFVCQDKNLLEKYINLFIKESGCLISDVSTIEPTEESGKSGEISVEKVRTFLHDISLSPCGKIRIGVIKNAERLNISSANILLKTLEEPPKNVVIILTVFSPNILPTIKSRCRLIKINTLMTPRSITYSYQEFLDGTLARGFKKIEEIVKANQVEKLLFDLLAQFEEKLVTTLDDQAANILEKIIKSRKHILGNANSRLVLENLILNIKTAYER
jgi:DNA polymerase III delta prime subunit